MGVDPGARGGGGQVSFELQQLVNDLAYKPGWSFRLEHGCTFSAASTAMAVTGTAMTFSGGSGNYAWPAGELATLVIGVTAPDSGDPSRMIKVEHRFAVAAAYRGSWRRWLIEQVLAVERHEACEFFQVAGERPFYPHHGPDGDLYAVREREAR